MVNYEYAIKDHILVKEPGLEFQVSLQSGIYSLVEYVNILLGIGLVLNRIVYLVFNCYHGNI